MNDRNIVILFGAGASFGADHVRPCAPPLGACLYDLLAVEYPKEWGSESHLGKMWSEQFRKNFEETMATEVLPKVSSLSLLEWHRCVADLFARYELDGTGRDNYSLLLSELTTTGLMGRVTFGSLNYDCLLEQAMRGLQFTSDYTLNTPDEGSIPVAKIHGSCNFITGDLFSKRAYLTNPNASSIECAFDTLPLQGLRDLLRERFSTYEPAFFPVLGLYSPDKPSLVAGGWLKKLRNTLTERINQAAAVVLIGIAPNPRDPHLWEPIMESPASRILYVGGQPDYETLRNRQGKTTHLASTFREGVETIVRTLAD